jgi:hypothetical protein
MPQAVRKPLSLRELVLEVSYQSAKPEVVAALDRHDELLGEMEQKLCRCAPRYTCEAHEWAAALRTTSPA